MKDETTIWLDYSKENLESAIILLKNKLFNPCLQNVQQCVEKALKALLVENSAKLKKTHRISELKMILLEKGFDVKITDEECEFLDSVYLPSKYPIRSVLPYYEPDLHICTNGILIAEKAFNCVQNILI